MNGGLTVVASIDGAGATASIWVASMRRSFPVVLSRLELDDESGKAVTVASRLDAELARIRGESDDVRPSCRVETVRTEPVSINFADEKHLYIAGVHRPENNVNLSLLTGLIPSSYPQSIDAETLKFRSSRRQKVTSYCVSADLVGNCILEESPTSTSIVPVVQFLGQVGAGDRSVRSDQPFPANCSSNPFDNFKVQHKAIAGWVSTSQRLRQSSSLRPLFGGSGSGNYSGTPNYRSMSNFLPSLQLSVNNQMWSSHGSDTSDDEYSQSEGSRLSHNVVSCHLSRTYRKCMSKLSRHSSTSDGNRPLRPFVAPTVVSDCGGILTVDVTPGLVAYFEVTIFHSSSGDRSGTVAAPREDGDRGGRVRHECVAIGLSTSQFRAHSKMPGWDYDSYGYHGDDGGVFHGKGEMIRQYGPKFGPGDNVGCGLDYASRRIFFCKNGEFLGYAFDWVDESLVETGLYPTVGLDSQCPIFVNYGSKPFRFDLQGFARLSGLND